MAQYRLYCLSGDGRISEAEVIEAMTDAEAIFAAKALKRPTRSELWNHDKMIAMIPATPERSNS